MTEKFLRVESLYGREGLSRIRGGHVCIAGYGAVGSFAAEALVRSGVGHIRLIDADVYELSNINRQLCAEIGTLGASKVECGRRHFECINRELEIETRQIYLNEGNCSAVSEPFMDGQCSDVVADAIDSVESKVSLLNYCVRAGVPVISSMGAARKRDPLQVCIDDISKTEVCPLARAVRKRLKKLGIEKGIRCVYSKESAVEMWEGQALGSVVTVTGVFGLILASEVLKKLMEKNDVR